MTNQTIPPCPVCGKVPEVVRFLTLPAIVTGCEHIALRHQTVEKWESACNKYLGRAFRELGIETVEQLNARLAPDPRVAVLAVLYNAASEWRGDHMSDHHLAGVFDTVREKLIAAQRGEGYK